jgi:AcrR family transcriptional regulator
VSRDRRGRSASSTTKSRATGRRTQEERSAETRERLIRAAIECIREHGYSATRTSEIASRAGVTRGALQHHFPSKPDLLLGVVSFVAEEIFDHLKTAREEKGPLPDRVRSTLRHLWEVYSSPEYHATTDILSAMRSDPDLHETLMPYSMQIEEVFSEWWTSYFSDVGVPVDRIEVTRLLVRNALRGMSIESDFPPRPPEFYEKELALLCELVTISLQGASAEPRNESPGAGRGGVAAS